ncbi:MAG: helix-turn-helix domain-containing protein [Candidatus Parvarchaeota archaeon]
MADKATILKEILALRNAGLGYGAIADRLRERGIADLSPSTVKRYLQEVQDEQSSIPSPSINQETSTETPENVRPANVKAPESNNNEVLSKLKKLKEIDKADKRAIKRLEIILFIAKIFFVSMVVFGVIIIILKLA